MYNSSLSSPRPYLSSRVYLVSDDRVNPNSNESSVQKRAKNLSGTFQPIGRAEECDRHIVVADNQSRLESDSERFYFRPRRNDSVQNQTSSVTADSCQITSDNDNIIVDRRNTMSGGEKSTLDEQRKQGAIPKTFVKVTGESVQSQNRNAGDCEDRGVDRYSTNSVQAGNFSDGAHNLNDNSNTGGAFAQQNAINDYCAAIDGMECRLVMH